MHFEIRLRGKKKHHYLAHSVRDGNKVKKVRKYLGADLSEEELNKVKGKAEQEIHEKIEENLKKDKSIEKGKLQTPRKPPEFIKTGVEQFDKLFVHGIPKGNSVIIAGGPGTGKTILTLQIANYSSLKGKRCLYISFEESEQRLKEHMEGFGWNPDKLEANGLLHIKRFDPFRLSRTIEALLAKARGELLIDVGVEELLPKNFTPEIIILDSISALASAFITGSDTYRVYIEQFFRYFERVGATAFLISETEDAPKKLSESGVEEFLADGVVVMYYIKRGNIRERAIEILKMRGAKHQEKIVAMEITEKGIVIYPEQEIFGETEK